MSCLVYLPRDRYTTKVRLRAQEILRTALHGVSVDYSAMVSNSALARLHVVVHGEPGRPLPKVDPLALQAEIAAAVRSWDEDLAAEADRQLGTDRASTLLLTCCIGIPETYKADVTPAAAVDDLSEVLGAARALRAVRAAVFTINPNGRVAAADLPPFSDHAVRRAAAAAAHGPRSRRRASVRVQRRHGPVLDLRLRPCAGAAVAARTDAGSRGARARVRGGAHRAVELEQTEDDAFNGLVLDAGLTWRQVVLLRAYARYLRQAGVRFSQDYLQRVLRSNAAITRLLVRMFESRFDPARQGGAGERCEAIAEELRGALDEVANLDHDRILRAYLALIEAHPAHQLLPARRFGRPGAVPGAQAGAGEPADGPGAAAEVRDLRVLAAARGSAPAVRPCGARRSSLVGAARGLPHRGARPGQGAGGQELGHRAVRRQGRVRLQAAARRGGPGGACRRDPRLLPDVHQRDARHHRQHRRR